MKNSILKIGQKSKKAFSNQIASKKKRSSFKGLLFIYPKK